MNSSSSVEPRWAGFNPIPWCHSKDEVLAELRCDGWGEDVSQQDLTGASRGIGSVLYSDMTRAPLG